MTANVYLANDAHDALMDRLAGAIVIAATTPRTLRDVIAEALADAGVMPEGCRADCEDRSDIDLPDDTASPREHVAAQVEELARRGWSGEHILQVVERQAFGFEPTRRKLAFFRVSDLNDKKAA